MTPSVSEPAAATAAANTSASAAQAPPTPSLKQLAIRGSAWTITGYGAQQVLRLGGNLILTRLLFPAAFGLMALVTVCLTGLEMFSDVGIRGSIIHHRRGDDREFLNTAWSLQVVRGLLLWAGAAAVAYPASLLYGEPALVTLLPIVGATAFLRGLSSVNIHNANRHLNVRALTALELTSQVAGLILTVSFAWVLRSVWGLVVGTLCGAVIRCLLTHWLIPGPRCRWRWNREDIRDLYRFGRWILAATALTFLIAQGDRLVLGRFMSAAELGVYSVAFMLSQAVIQAVNRLSQRVLFPAYAKLLGQSGNRLRKRVQQTRMAMFAVFLPVLVGLAIFGQYAVDLVYDSRYSDAGWMLQILAAGAVGDVVALGAGGEVLRARGDSQSYMILQVARASVLAPAMAVGGALAGGPGIIVGIAMSKWIGYAAVAWGSRRSGVWTPKVDLSAFGAASIVIALGWWCTGSWGLAL